MAVGKFIKAHGYRTKPVYKCVVCEKMTRETGDGESQVEMCKQCYFEGGQENQHSDCHYGNMEDCHACQEANKDKGYELKGEKWCDNEKKPKTE